MTLALAAATLVQPTAAFADGAHEHAAGGGDVPPAAATIEAPAPGAQPAAPANVAAPTVEANAGAGAAAGSPGAADTGRAEEPAPIENAVATPVDPANATNHANHAATPDPEPIAEAAPLASGGGTSPTAVPTGGGAAAAGPPSGALPFTGPEDNILIIALAGMFAPIGVLLYCGARRSEHRWLRRHLAAPRFEWVER